MSRYIDAVWIAQKLEWWRDQLAETHGENDEYVLCLGEVLMKLDDTPTADVRENVKGEWVKEIKHHKDDEQEYDYYDIYCSACGEKPEKAWHLTNYCPNCGADMRGEA